MEVQKTWLEPASTVEMPVVEPVARAGDDGRGQVPEIRTGPKSRDAMGKDNDMNHELPESG